MTDNIYTQNRKTMKNPIRFISEVVRGYGRGSAELGIPTANLSREKTVSSVSYQDLPCGIYWGFGTIIPQSTLDPELNAFVGTCFTAAVSIGYNPYYNNTEKTIEPHFIAPRNDPRRHSSSTEESLLPDFYGSTIRLSIVEFLRPELPFEGLPKLIDAIKKDIIEAERAALKGDEDIHQEIRWILCKDGI